MAKIVVTVRSDKGGLGIHPKHGQLFPKAKITIEEEEFAPELFERPKGFLSPHEKADQDRAAKLQCRVGHQDPPAESERSDTSESSEPAPAAGKKAAKEVTVA